MSPDFLDAEIHVSVEPVNSVSVKVDPPTVYTVAAGNIGPPGRWTQMTQAEYDALSPPNPHMLYVIIG